MLRWSIWEMTLRRFDLLALVSMLAFAAPAAANFDQQAQVPNGGALACTGCHPGGDSTQFTLFGAQMRDLPNGTADWATLCGLDADGDGATNGAELGDPGCVFPQGNDYGNYASDPNDPASRPPVVEPTPDLGMTPDGAPRETGDAVVNLDDGCVAAPGGVAVPGAAPGWWALLLVLIGWRRRR